MRGILAVHLGAGSVVDQQKYRDLLWQNYRQLDKVMATANCDVKILIEASIDHIENSALVNAGSGSNLNLHGQAECDASFLSHDVNGREFFAVAALNGFANPFAVAMRLFYSSRSSFGCVKVPRILCGDGAAAFAQRVGFTKSTCLNDNAIREYLNNRKILQEYLKQNSDSNSLFDCNEIAHLDCKEDINIANCLASNNSCAAVKSLAQFANMSDTIGACFTGNEVAIGCSTGGPALKYPGRVGHVPLPGCSSWSLVDGDVRISSMSSGDGEQLMLTRLCESCCSLVKATVNEQILQAFFKQHCHYEFGIIVCRYDSRRHMADLVIAHSTRNFVYSHLVINNGKVDEPFINISTKRNRLDFHLEIKSVRVY